ncbi:hypothetical protein GAN28_16270 [Bacteroides thetaiotaomicron]|nr:hypothetical protein GAN28_16270 [Bacteroides thetaiotaomicron]KAB4724181.1 hypothetical protein GAH01_26000 [Bacteroides thetaiotaomicron]
MTDAEKTLLSSLGTNAALKDWSNVTTQNLGQNGYCKFPNGLLIQWGMSPGVLGNHKTILPISFSNTDYIVTSTIQGMDTSLVMFSTVIYTKYTGYFYGWAKIEAGTWTSWKFNWIAIGRWK